MERQQNLTPPYLERSMASTTQKKTWIINPTTDLTCITLGWTVFFVVPFYLPQYAPDFHFLAVTSFVAHRYFTFPLVYLDRTEFNRSRSIYIVTPILCLAFVALCYYFKVEEPEMFAFWYFFNFFHFVRQKYGILRIYSGKAQWGHKRLDEWTTYTWALAGFFYMLTRQADLEGKLMHYLQSLTGPLPLIIADSIYAIAVLLTLFWLIHECRAPKGLSVPKLLFLVSVAFMYGIAPILSTNAMADATAFSHAAEYIALVALTLQNKARANTMDAPILNKAANHVVRYTASFILVVSLLLYGLKFASLSLFLIFTYGTSFAHFIFDGMIWKLRRPKVAREVGTIG